ncbi:MAG: transposase [Patescibacteria group bacterium]
MPEKHSIKHYEEEGIYHIFNRGIDKRDIFLDDQDYKYFLYLLKAYLTEMKDSDQDKGVSLLQRGRFKDKIDLLAYCLMPNHFHLLVKQTGLNDMSLFMRSLMTNYSMYFNKKYDRLGPLYQGVFKAILVKEDDYLLHLSRYIHLNPYVRERHLKVRKEYTSYEDYLGLRNTQWVNTDLVLDYFKSDEVKELHQTQNYKDFIEELVFDSGDYLGKYTID